MAQDTDYKDVARPACFSSTITECLFVLTATFAFAQSTIFSGMATVMTDSIGRDLNMGNELTWVTAAPLLTSGAFVLPFGNLADMVGRKPMFIAAMTCSTFAVAVAGFAPNGLTLIILNAFFGLFSAAAVTPALGQLGSVYHKPSKRRNRAFACFSAGNPMGYVGGSFISGVVMQLSGWRACFWSFAVLNAIFTILVLWTVPSHSASGGRLWDVMSRFDVIGALSVTGGVSMLSSALTLGGTAPQGWGTPYVIVLLILGVLTIAFFIWWQSIYKHPLMPLHVWRDPDFAIHITSISAGNAGFTAATFWLCLYLQRVKHQTPLSLALYLLPQNINGILVNVVISFIMHRVSHMLLTGIGAIAYIVSFLLLALVQPIGEYYWAFIFPSLMLVVVGSELQFNVANSYVMSSLPEAQKSLAGGILSAVNKVFSNISLTISTAVHTADMRRASTGIGKLHLEKGYSGAFWVSVALAVVDLVLVFFLKADEEGYDKTSLAKSQDSTTSDEEVVIDGGERSKV